jgi:hypothetical protein
MSLTAARDGRSFATGTRFDSSGTNNGMVQLFRGNCDDVTAPVIPQVFYYGDETITVAASDYATAAAEQIEINTHKSGSRWYATLSNGALSYNSAVVVDSPESNVGTLQNPILVDISSASFDDIFDVYRGKTYRIFTGFGGLVNFNQIYDGGYLYTGGGLGAIQMFLYGRLFTIPYDAPNTLYIKENSYSTSKFILRINDPLYAVSSSNNIVAGTPGTYTITYSGNSTSNTQTVILT